MLTLTGVSNTRTAKDGRDYFVATFRPGFGQKEVRRTFWQQFRRDPSTNEILHDAQDQPIKYWERASPEEAKALLASGEMIQGDKVTAQVEAYQLGDRMVSQYSTAVFPDEKAERVFENQNHPMVDTKTGELIISKKKAVISTTPKEESSILEDALKGQES